MEWRRPKQRNYSSPVVRTSGLVAGLFVVAVFAAAFTVAVVQLQASVSGYLAANGLWSRGQAETVRYLDRYAETGDSRALEQARNWYQIPLSDLRARQAMESGAPDYDVVREHLLRGRFHPEDIPRVITLFPLFSETPYFRDALEAWRNTDTQILELGRIADQLEAEWTSDDPSQRRIEELRQQLEKLSIELISGATAFRRAMVEAGHTLTWVLSVAGVGFFLLLGGIAALLMLRLTRAIRQSEQKFRATFEQAAVGIAQGDKQGRFLEANQALCDILGYSREELLQMRYPSLIHPEDKWVGRHERQAAAAGKLDSYTIEQRMIRADGETIWVKVTVSGFSDQTDPSAMRYIAIVEDVSESRRLSEELSHQATHDDLTGLLNRRAFERYLGEYLRRAHSENSVHALCFIDLDQFKIVNDTQGHVVGDQLLRQVAGHLGEHLRKGDLLARLGGDEFGLILDRCDPQSAVMVAEKLRRALDDATFNWQGYSFSAACSIGVVPITSTADDTTELLRAADTACQLAKERGRNRVHMAEDNDVALTERREQMEWVGRIRSALEEDRLYLDAQSIASLTDPSRVRYEVLVRMLDENGHTVPPGAFLPASERFGLAHLIDRWVMEHVCRQLQEHPEHLAKLEACHVNISGRSFDHEDFIDFVVGLLGQYAVPPEKLCFEITETAAIRHLSDVHAFMERLGGLGCTFALDDFGAGLSSFGYLRDMPVDLLKIDGSFVRNIANDETDCAMVRAINDIGQTLGKTIVAEFVEDDNALNVLREMGVHYGQGFGIHRPSSFLALIASG